MDCQYLTDTSLALEHIIPPKFGNLSHGSILPVDDQIDPPTPDIKWKIGAQLTKEQREKVVNLLEENRDCFAFSLEDLGTSYNTPMTIPLATNEPVFQSAHRLSPTEWEFVDQNCQKLLSLGMIRKSKQTKYASSTVVVRIKDEEGNYTDFRQCGDYRPLNGHTELHRYQLPNIEDIFRDMQNASMFSKLDLRQGYYQVPITEEDKCRTTIWGPFNCLR